MRRTTTAWVDSLGRFGFFARGVVYLIIGFLSGRAAFLEHGRPAGPGGALRALFAAPFGKFAVVALAVGFFSFSLFRFAQAALARSESRTKRFGWACGALGTVVLGISALRLLLHYRSGGDGAFLRNGTRRILGESWGRPLLIGIGATLVIVGAVEAFRFFSGRLKDQFAGKEMSTRQRRWSLAIARFGHLAHGAVIIVIGTYLVRAGVRANVQDVRDTGGALRTVALFPFGPLLLGVIAAGLIAYGLSLWILARYRLV